METTGRRTSERARAVMRDAGLTALVGPVRLLVVTLGTLALYRVVLARAGLDTVGLWTILNVVMALASLADVGFSQVLVREAHGANLPGGAAGALRDKRAVELFHRGLLVFVVVPAAVAAAWIWPDLPYDRAHFSLALALVAWVGVAQAQSSLEAAVLAAIHENAHIQAASAAASILFLAVSLAGCLADVALDGIALGNLSSALIMRWWLRRRWMRSCPAAAPPAPMPLGEAVKRVTGMARRGRHFYALSLGNILREPLFRLVIATFLGVRALGVYAIAFRAGVATRDMVAGGFEVLYPAMSALKQGGNNQDLREMHGVSIIVLTMFGCGALGCLYGLAGPALTLVLGHLPEGLVGATRILAIWNLITLFNVSFIHQLKAHGLEKAVAAALWMHTAAILMLWPVLAMRHWELESLLWYWTATSLAAQAPIFVAAQRRLDLFWTILKIPAVRNVLLMAAAYLAAVVGLSSEIPGVSRAEFAVVSATTVFLLASFGASWGTLKHRLQRV